MKPLPYYDHAGITIYHGDCRDILPHIKSVDLVLTDPPYGVAHCSGGDARKYKKAHCQLPSAKADGLPDQRPA